MRQLTPKERFDLYDWLDQQYYYDPKPGGMCYHIRWYLANEGFGVTQEEIDDMDENEIFRYLPELNDQKPPVEERKGFLFWYPSHDIKSRRFIIQKARTRCLKIVQEASISK
jgi:hypothetical protein